MVADAQAAISAADAQAIACNYEEAAGYINDQGMDPGRDAIVASHLNLVDIFGSYDPVVGLTTEFDDTVRVLFSFDVGWALIEDGCDIFQVEAGRVQRHIRHGFIEVTGPPPSESSLRS